MPDAVEILTSRVLVSPADLERSLRFYGEILGLAVYREWGTGSSRGVAFFLGGGAVLEVSGASSVRATEVVKLVLQVRDVKVTYERLTAHGVEIAAAPDLKPWGLLEMSVRDPDGLELVFVEVPPGHPRRQG